MAFSGSKWGILVRKSRETLEERKEEVHHSSSNFSSDFDWEKSEKKKKV